VPGAMRSPSAVHPPLVSTILPAASPAATLARSAVLALAGSLLLTASAKAAIPLWPVPFTMQTFAVLVIGMAYGWRLGAATVLLYLAQGALGLPVFQGGGGIGYMLGWTGGYLLAFPLAAALVGWLAERGWGRHFLATAAAQALGTALIFLFGVAWLARLEGLSAALASGLYPFVPGALLKIALATALVPAAWHWKQRFARGE